MLEEGEIESGEESRIYRKLDRPQFEANVIAGAPRSPDSSTSSSSDERIPRKKFLDNPRPATSASLSKNGSLWKNLLQEESLMENLKTCDVSSDRKRKYERGAESYDFKAHKAMAGSNDGAKTFKKHKLNNGNESSSSSSSLKRVFKKSRRRQKKKILPELSVPIEDSSDEAFGRNMAQNLEEEKSELIVKVVSVIGKESSLKLYKITQKIEREGGMLTMNKTRRRTPGGIFLFMLKTSDKIGEDLKSQIFDSEKKKDERINADRKLSTSEAKDPPNSPANSDLVDSNKLTDPDLVSQTLRELGENENDLLEINHNMEFF